MIRKICLSSAWPLVSSLAAGRANESPWGIVNKLEVCPCVLSVPSHGASSGFRTGPGKLWWLGFWLSPSLCKENGEGKWEMHWILLQVWKRPSSQRQGPLSLAPFYTPCQECPLFVRNKGVEDFGREEFCFRSRESCHCHENCNLGENSQVRDLEASNTARSKQFSIWTDGLVQLGVPLGHFLGPPYPYKKSK